LLKDDLQKAVIFLFTINPAYAYHWAKNLNVFAIASAIKKFEEAVRSENERTMIDYLKILVPIGILFFILAMAFYIVTMAVHSGQLSVQPAPSGIKI